MNPTSTRYLRAALLALLAWSALLYLLAVSGLGGRYAVHPDDPAGVPPLADITLNRAESQLEPLSDYAVVADRPLFNPDRRPLPPANAPAAEPVAAAPVAAPLDVMLTGVVLAGDKRIAIFSDPTGESESLRIGQSLSGDRSVWKLVELEPRAAVFEGPGGRSRVDLRLFDGQGGQAPTPVAVPTPEALAAPESAPAGEAEQTPESRAEMIRKRIEERRRQMREEAARANQERGQ